MRVLLVDAPPEIGGPNWIGALLYAGLCDELGAENVTEWPRNRHYHERVQGHGCCGETCGFFPWLNPRTESSASNAEPPDVTSFDLVVIGSPKDPTIALARQVEAAASAKRIVLLDGEDYTQVRWDLVEQLRPSAYFKVSTWPKPWPQFLEEKKRVEHTVKLVPFSMATTVEGAPIARPKTTDICLLGGHHFYGPRREGVAEDRPLQKPIFEQRLRFEFPDAQIVTGTIPYHGFIEALAQSKIAVTLGGHGLEPVRTYETLSCADTLVVRWESGHIAPAPLIHGTHCSTWHTLDEMINQVRHYLQNDEERLRVARAGNDLLLEHYTPRARARHLLRETFS